MCPNSRQAPLVIWRATLPSRPAQLPWLRHALQSVLTHADARIPARQHAKILLAMHELVLNAMTHARPSPVVIECRVGVRRCCCIVRDRGEKIMWPRGARALPPVTQTSGRGLWLAQHIGHALQYRRVRGENVIQVEWQWD